jgi:enoyl-CoA hydratase/carnithine racemase
MRHGVWVPAHASLGRDDDDEERNPDMIDALNAYFEGLQCSRSEDFGEGIRAFLEKRKPVYIRR